VLSKIASANTPPNVLNQEDVLKFNIGLRLLGEAKRQRYLTYLQQLTEQGNQPEGEETNDDL
jgi:hypothetical protein